MAMLHPIATTEHIRESYLRYLKTIYPFQDETLRAPFWQALEEPERLVKGPLLEAAPPFEHGRSIEQLVAAGVLNHGFEQLCSDALPWDRPLYRHQDRAIEKVVDQQRNLIVATGTGSGKTETFLLPILDHLLREQAAGTLDQPGVRALLLYPMNALANDQLKRLRRVLAAFPTITFGRYTGETEEDDARALSRFHEQFPNEQHHPNELLSRKTLRERPPHILLTNYAMLEYLLLRPDDCAFFDGEKGQHWRFIALDEAHIYDGAIGIEIAMLIRRFKERVVQSAPGQIQCIATSATLGRGRVDFPAAVTFASNLFGEQFEWDEADAERQDVVESARVAIAELGTVWGTGTPVLYASLFDTVQALDGETTFDEDRLPDVQQVLSPLFQACAETVPTAIQQSASQTAQVQWHEASGLNLVEQRRSAIDGFLYEMLRGDSRIHALHSELRKRPQLATSVATAIFPEAPPQQASEMLVHLVHVAVRARPTPASLSILPARYHVFARALEGAFVCLQTAAHPDNQPRIFLSRHEQCPDCGGGVVELASCTRCGGTYIVGQYAQRESNGTARRFQLLPLSESGDSQGDKAYFLLSEQATDIDEDEAVVSGEEADDGIAGKPYVVCVRCLDIHPGAALSCDCGSNDAHVHVFRVDLKGKPEPHHCIKCGSRSNGNIIFRFLTGQDAPVSVLATALYQQLPVAPDVDAQQLPGGGRKLLIFSDSRQDAAFFAPYLERTYNQVLHRRLLLKSLLDDPDGLSGDLRLQDMTSRLMKQAQKVGLFQQNMSRDERQRVVNTWLMQEFVALDRRISLEGLGMLMFRLARPERWQLLPALQAAPWNLSDTEVWQLLALLLDTLRMQAIVTFPDNVDPQSDEFAPRNRNLYIREEGSDAKAGILSWLPVRGSNRRIDLLERVLSKENPAMPGDERRQHAIQALRGIWKHLTEPRTVWREHLLSTTLPGKGVVYRLSHEFWELVPSEKGQGWRCSSCRALSAIDLRGVCPTKGCKGTLEPLQSDAEDLSNNHYRSLYRELEPIAFTAEEHTAQWTSEEAGKIQEQFVEGRINALSCSTTFELGVDVGELNAVLMRNVPPTTANYIQRAGRAGRRTDSAAFALTYAQRRSHDLAHYTTPEQIVAGTITTPRIVLTNEKIVRRHVQAVLIAAFFRAMREEDGRSFNSVGTFFQPEDETTPGPKLLTQYADELPEHVQGALRRIVPQELQTTIGVEDWGWLRRTEEDGLVDLLKRATDEVSEDFTLYEQLQMEAVREKQYRTAETYQQVLRTLRGRALLGFFASRNILPKYGFPTDIVSLRTEHLSVPDAARVQLERDLRIAISEYAPGAEVVAAKRVWRSGGLYRQPKKDWQVLHYAVCTSCGRFHQGIDELPSICPTCGEPLSNRQQLRGKYIKPVFGFVVPHNGMKPTSETRPQRSYSSRVYFSEYAPHASMQAEPQFNVIESVTSELLQVKAYYSRFGKLALVNAGPRGRGFRICQHCGFAEVAPEPPPPGTRRVQKEQSHKHPRTGKECKPFMQTFHLGHDFLTDVVELRLSGALANHGNEALWRSLVYALLEGASRALSIRRDDIDGTLYHYGDRHLPAIVLFDNVPGGAGHVQRIAEQFHLVFQETYGRVRNACCGPETSCYECLRNYRNQVYHDVLKRGMVEQFLRRAIHAAENQNTEGVLWHE